MPNFGGGTGTHDWLLNGPDGDDDCTESESSDSDSELPNGKRTKKGKITKNLKKARLEWTSPRKGGNEGGIPQDGTQGEYGLVGGSMIGSQVLRASMPSPLFAWF